MRLPPFPPGLLLIPPSIPAHTRSPPPRPALLTPCMEHGCQDGGEPGSLAVAGLELTLQFGEEDADARGEAQGEALCHHGGQQHHPGPAALGALQGLGHPWLRVLRPQPDRHPGRLGKGQKGAAGRPWPPCRRGWAAGPVPSSHPGTGFGRGAPPPGRWPEVHALALASPFPYFSEPAWQEGQEGPASEPLWARAGGRNAFQLCRHLGVSRWGCPPGPAEAAAPASAVTAGRGAAVWSRSAPGRTGTQ